MNSAVTKRAACDRCRDQKLRCPRVNSTAEPCGRCMRAHAICVTSSSRPNGRPRISSAAVAEQGPNKPAVNGGVLGLTPNRPSPMGRSPNANRTPEQTSMPLWSPGATFDAYPDFFGSSGCPSASYTVFPGQTESTKSQTSSPGRRQSGMTNFVGLQLLGEEHDGDPSVLDLGRNTSMTESDLLENIVNYDPSNSAGWAMQLVGDMDVDEQNGTSAALADPRIRLSKLSEVMVQQLNRAGTYSWRPSQVSANCLAKGQGMDQNPLAQVLQSNSELAAVLQQMSCGQTDYEVPDPAISASTPASAASMGAPPSTPTILLILATWLQLVELYDKLFGHVRDALQEMPADAISAFRGPMGMLGPRVPGMGLMQGDLSVKIMIQVIQHQLEGVELLLGLPDEYCVARRGGAAVGKTHVNTLFARHDVEAHGLLQPVMMGLPNGAGKATVLAGENKGSTGHTWNVMTLYALKARGFKHSIQLTPRSFSITILLTITEDVRL